MTGTASPSGRTDRIAGALLGVHAGDALGATLEFSPWLAIRARYPAGLHDIVGGGPFGWPAGHATDDTDLTRAVLFAYLAPGDGDVVRSAADNMLAWLDGHWPGREPGSRPRDIGGATLQGLERYRRCGDPRAAGAGPGQAGNGSLMRCIPTALAVADRDRRIRDSIEISAITHDDQRATIACAAYNEIAAGLTGDRAGQFTEPFDAVFTAAGIRILLSPPQAPKANAICERMIGTLRREVLDRLLILDERHLRQALTEYLQHYNTARPHRTLHQLPPAQADTPPLQIDLARHQIRRKQVLGSLTSEYPTAA